MSHLRAGRRVASRLVLALLAILIGCEVGAAAERPRFQLLELEGVRVQWSAGKAGTPVLTYAVLKSSRNFASAFNCRGMTSPERLLAASGVDDTSWRAELTAAFDMWEQVADIRFIEASDDAKPDILIGAQAVPNGRAFTNVDYDRSSQGPIKQITSALICLNPSMPWKVGFDGDLSVYDLRYTIAHEIGHAIGLDHPASSGQVMGFRYDERFRDLQSGDIAGAQALYGARQIAQRARP